MSKSSIFCVTLVAIIGILIPVCLPVFAQVGPSNPNANITTAYKLLHGNQTGGFTSVPPLTVQTDLPTYNQGDGVIITGHVKNPENATAVTLRIFSSLKNLISVAQFQPTADGTFTKTFLATGPLWRDAGNYTVVAQYGRYTTVNATFHFTGGNGLTTVSLPTEAIYPLQSGGQTYAIPYIIKGGMVKSMDIFADKYTLEITINAPSDGSITITLPRAMIDAKILANLTKDQIMTGVKVNSSDLEDGNFIVTAGNNLVTFSEIKNPQTRILSIPFHAGDTKIDIVGTIIVPEFGPIVGLVLAIAIISIIAVSAKTGLRLMPKY